MRFSEQDRERISARVAALEARTGVQVVTAVVAKSDAYPEAPWKAFALGAAIVALVLALRSVSSLEWEAGAAAVRLAATILGTGAACAFLVLLLPGFARLFVDRLRREAEVGQHARALFVDRGLGHTHGHVGILLLASLFERKVVLLADDGFDGRIGEADWQVLTQRVTLLLRKGDVAVAFVAALDGMEALLLARGFRGEGMPPGELPNVIVQARAAP